MCLDRIGGPARGADRPAEQDVIREDDVGGQAFAQSRGIQLDVALALCARQVLQEPRLEPLVAVEHEDGQRPADLRTHDLGAAEVVQLRVSLLAEQDDVVPGAAPLPRERARVDVRARPAQEVPVPDEDSRFSGQVEVERIEELDGGIRRVDGDVGRHVEQRLASS